MLTLPIKKKWFEMIQAGEKKEEYRDITPYYHARLRKFLNMEKEIKLRNGYRADSPAIICKCKIVIGSGRPEWGAEPEKSYYVLKILGVSEVRKEREE